MKTVFSSNDVPSQLVALLAGPVARCRDLRLALAERIAKRTQVRFGSDLLFCALYGSVVRETDGDHSDIELFCACGSGEMPCQIYEWIEEGIKVKLRVYTETGLIEETLIVDTEWALSHNKIFYHRILIGSSDPLEKLQYLALNVEAYAFSEAITHIYLAEVYEMTAKLYNLFATPDFMKHGGGIVLIKLLEQVALILGLTERRCFSTRQRMLNEAIDWHVLPGAFPQLCQIALSGNWQEGTYLEPIVRQLWAELGAFLHEQNVLTSIPILSFQELNDTNSGFY